MMISKEIIETIDKENMWQLLMDFPQQWEKAMELSKHNDWRIDPKRVKNICMAGMGSSAIAAEICTNYVFDTSPVPIYINKHFKLPRWVNSETLCIFFSFSGNTEETLSAFQEAENVGAQIAVITSGGKLLVNAAKLGIGYYKIPTDHTQRTELAHSFLPVYRILQLLNALPETEECLTETLNLLQVKSESYQNLSGNEALSLANELVNCLPLIYSDVQLLQSVNLRWRNQLEENSKTIAYGNLFPEMTHNEIVGWQQVTHLTGRLAVIFLEDQEINPRIKEQMNIVTELIEDQAVSLHRVLSSGKSRVSRMFSLIQIGDWVSYYLALLQKVDPTPTAKIEILKGKLSEHN